MLTAGLRRSTVSASGLGVRASAAIAVRCGSQVRHRDEFSEWFTSRRPTTHALNRPDVTLWADLGAYRARSSAQSQPDDLWPPPLIIYRADAGTRNCQRFSHATGAASMSRSQVAIRTACVAARLTWEAPSVNVRWRPSLAMGIVTHSLGYSPREHDRRFGAGGPSDFQEALQVHASPPQFYRPLWLRSGCPRDLQCRLA